MKRGQSKKIAIMISYITMLIQVGGVFFITPYILNKLGYSEYGLYQYVSSTVTYLSLLGFGFSSAYIRFYSRYQSKNDEQGISRLNGMFMALFLAIALLCLAIGLVLCLNISSVFGSKLDDKQYGNARIMLAVLTINMALTFPKSIFVCNTTANEKFVFQKSVTLILDILTPILQIVLLNIIEDVQILSYVTLIITSLDFLFNIIYNIFFLKMRFLFGVYDYGLLKEIVSFTFYIFLNQIFDILGGNNVDNYIIGRIEGPESVAIYSIGSKLNQVFMAVSSPISVVFIPQIYRIVEENDDKQRLSKIFTDVGKIQFIFLYLILSGFVVWGKPFIRYWVGDGFDSSYYIAIVLMASYLVAKSQSIGIEIQRAENKHKARSVVYFLIDIVNVIISIPLVMNFGAIGAAIGTAIAMFSGTGVFMNIYYSKVIGLKMSHYWGHVFRIVVVTLPCVVLGFIERLLIGTNYLVKIVFQIIMFSFSYLLVIYLFILDATERAIINSFIKSGRKMI